MHARPYPTVHRSVVEVLALQFRLVSVPLVDVESVEFATMVAVMYGLEVGMLMVLMIPAVVIGRGAV